MSNFVKPPKKPENVSAQVVIRSTLTAEPADILVWIGIPYFNSQEWICEEHVEGFSQRKVYGKTSLQALSNALSVARIDLEGLISLGYVLTIPEHHSKLSNRDALQELFSVVPLLDHVKSEERR